MSDQDEVVIVHRSPTRRKGYAQVPHVVTTDRTLSDGAVRLYCLLHSYAFQADSFRCSQGKMATDIGKDDRTVRRLLKELSDRGLVTTVRTGNRQVNAYILEDAYALYDSELPKPPKPQKQVRREIRPVKNVLSPDRSKMSGHGGQKCPVVEDKNVLLLNNSEEKESRTNKPMPPPVSQADALGEAVSELVSFGISTAEAERAVSAHSPARCREVAGECPPYPEAKRRARWIVKALAEGWQTGEPPRSWKIGTAAGHDIDALIARHGRAPVVLELERRAAESERQGQAAQAERRRRIVANLRAGMAGNKAVAAASEAAT